MSINNVKISTRLYGAFAISIALLIVVVTAAVVILAMTVYCATEVMQADRDGVRHLAKWLWFIVVLILPVIGPALWLLFGRPTADSVDDAPDRRPLGPEDDPDFLRRL